MTREETKKCIEVMQAYVDGKTVGYMRNDGNGTLFFSESKSPAWNWFHENYIVKLQPMKVTEEERILLQIKGRIIKAKNSNYITIVNDGDVELLRNEFYFLNKETQEWEDWNEDADTLKHFYNGGQP